MNIAVEPDPDRLAVIGECMDNYDIGNAEDEWPINIISRHAIVYNDGTIARRTDTISHEVDAGELALCRRLSKEIAALMGDTEIGMGSEGGDRFCDFFIMAPTRTEASRIDEALIRQRFGGTIFPPATVIVEPIADNTVWWGMVETDGAESEPSYFDPWRAMVAWFNRQEEFAATAFICIGDRNALDALPETAWPPGTMFVAGILPRLALGLTRKGSLVGLFGYVVQT